MNTPLKHLTIVVESISPYKVKSFFLENQGFFNVIPLLNEPEGWASQSIWYKNRGVLGIRIRTSLVPIFMAVV